MNFNISETTASMSLEDWAQSVFLRCQSGQLVEAIDLILSQAILHKVSDVHFRSEETGIRVLLRKDGQLHELLVLPPDLGDMLFTRLKVLGKLVSYQKRVPQDGHIDPHAYTSDPAIDLRLAIAPSVTGEQAVVRILYGCSDLLPLASLGWEGPVLRRYQEVLTSRRGVILFTGPCGSGKTTTIAASLQALLADGPINICTVEDPVEYRLPGVSQMAVDRVAGVGFAEGIRAWLRHDPDVLAVGEIRDSDTAAVVMEAGLIGHLVFSTVHGGSVPAILVRLLDMGIAPGTLAASISLIVSQRLLRVLCQQCRQLTDRWPEGFTENARPDEVKQFFVEKGCADCDFSGFKGRRGLFEMVIVDDLLREAILARSSIRVFKEVIQKTATSTLWGHGWNLVKAGVTTPMELCRVIGE